VANETLCRTVVLVDREIVGFVRAMTLMEPRRRTHGDLDVFHLLCAFKFMSGFQYR